jgi:cytochrome c biogenesis protein CcmG/thiol:disulfide interchange protein DsbE
VEELRRPSDALSSLRGKTVVLNFWASWCLPCKKEAPLLERAWQKWRARGVVVVGVDANDFASDGRRFMRRYKITYPVVHDGPGNWLDDYGLTGFPETFFVRPDGRIVAWKEGQLHAAELESGIQKARAS